MEGHETYTPFLLDLDMTQKDKNLLLKDLSGRIPYNVKIQTPDGDTTELYSIGNCEMDDTKMRLFINGGYYPDVVKPYLRPMSSMTKEEREELCELCEFFEPYNDRDDFSHYGIEIIEEFCVNDEKIPLREINYKVLDWLNTRHFDYRGLIEKGLALEAPEGMYKTE